MTIDSANLTGHSIAEPRPAGVTKRSLTLLVLDALGGMAAALIEPLGAEIGATCHIVHHPDELGRIPSGDVAALLTLLDPAAPMAIAASVAAWRQGEDRPRWIALWAGAAPAADGADYVASLPVRWKDLAAILLAPSPARPRFAHRFFDPAGRILSDSNGARVRLTEKEAALLDTLGQADGRPISRMTLLTQIWRAKAQTSTRTVESHMYRLRGKLHELGEIGLRLETTADGYRLIQSASDEGRGEKSQA